MSQGSDSLEWCIEVAQDEGLLGYGTDDVLTSADILRAELAALRERAEMVPRLLADLERAQARIQKLALGAYWGTGGRQ